MSPFAPSNVTLPPLAFTFGLGGLAIFPLRFGAAATLLLTLNALRYPADRLPLLLGWGWFGLAVLVIAIPLPTDYLLHGPRLLYLGSVGLAVVWAVGLAGVWPAGALGPAGTTGVAACTSSAGSR